MCSARGCPPVTGKWHNLQLQLGHRHGRGYGHGMTGPCLTTVWPGKPWQKSYKAKPLFLFGGDIVAGFFWRSFQCLNVRTVTPLCFVKSLFGLNFATMYISLIILLILGCSIQPNAAISRHTKNILWLIGNIPPIIIWWGLRYMHAACAERLRPRPPKKNQGEGVKDCWHSKSKARLCLGLCVKLVFK